MVYQSFSATHKLLNQTSQWYDNNSVAYINSSQSNYTYDAADNLTGEENDNWYNGQWRHSSKYTNQYDALHNRTFRQLDYYQSSILMYAPHERTYYYYTLINTGVDELNASATVALYPNPVNGGAAHIVFDNVNGTDVNVSIYDLSGRIISTENRPVVPGFNDLALDISYLSTGQYLVSINDASGAQHSTVKMIKQ
jgi:YD repeat-containing protein